MTLTGDAAGGFAIGDGSAARAIDEREFALFQSLVYREAGIYLSTAKRALLVARLSRRLRILGLESFAAYYRYVVSGAGGDERVHMLDCITTNETHFFREPRQFDFLASRVLPDWEAEVAAGRRSRRLRAWSAGCSTGEEPFSLAMILLDRCPPASGWSVEITASDLSTKVLDRARQAEWPLRKADEIPHAYLKRFMLKGVGSNAGRMKAGPEIRSIVHFRRLNLNEPSYPVDGPFDLMFCRNVLIYFDSVSRGQVLARLLDRLAPNGLLFLGHAESLTGVTGRLQCVIPNVYAWPEAARPNGGVRGGGYGVGGSAALVGA